MKFKFHMLIFKENGKNLYYQKNIAKFNKISEKELIKAKKLQ
jgi:hypothetical protein